MSTPGVYHDECGGYHEYTGGCSVHRGVIMSTPGGYQDACGGYHEYTGGCSVLMVSPTVLMITPRCTEHSPVYCTGIMQGEALLQKSYAKQF